MNPKSLINAELRNVLDAHLQYLQGKLRSFAATAIDCERRGHSASPRLKEAIQQVSASIQNLNELITNAANNITTFSTFANTPPSKRAQA